MIDTPTEIYASIIEAFISAHAEPTPNNPTPEKPRVTKFIPRGYLTPLLRVSKQWYANSAKYLYRSIAVGSHRRLPGQEIAKALHRTLKANPELAAFVERLQLGTNFYDGGEWTQKNIDILQLCPNVVHVQIHGYNDSKFDALLKVLGEKSLVSFSIVSRYLRDICVMSAGSRTWKIFDLMQHWPELRSLQLQGEDMNRIPLEQYQTSGFCPNLREIEIMNVRVRPILYTGLRTMCSNVTKFSVRVFGEVPHELCECLRAWSATLEYLSVKPISRVLSLPFTEVLATLTELRVLELDGLVVDWDVISNLPRLERFCLETFRSGLSVDGEISRRMKRVEQLSTLLKNTEKFPSLTHIAGDFTVEALPAIIDEFLNICRGRDIHFGYDYSACQAFSTPTRRFWKFRPFGVRDSDEIYN